MEKLEIVFSDLCFFSNGILFELWSINRNLDRIYEAIQPSSWFLRTRTKRGQLACGRIKGFRLEYRKLSILKILSGANALEISDIQEERNRELVPECNNFTLLHCNPL